MTSVPFLTTDRIEEEAASLLAGYEARFGLLTEPPIPADEILNVYLKVGLDFDDLPKLLNTSTDVFGATWLESAQVIIDQSLDPTNHPEKLGRYNFTIGHETGHWHLHRKYFLRDSNQQELFTQELAPAVVCRASQSKQPIEWQADYFSSCLLMPKRMLREWCNAKYGFERITLDEIRRKHGLRRFDDQTADSFVEKFARPIARDFAVSPIAMRIRLENLRVLMIEEPVTLFAQYAPQIQR